MRTESLLIPHMDPTRPSLQDTSPPVNPVDITHLDAMIVQQGQALVVHQELQAALQATNTQLRQAMGNPFSSGSKPVRMALPDKFDDSPDTCKDERVWSTCGSNLTLMRTGKQIQNSRAKTWSWNRKREFSNKENNLQSKQSENGKDSAKYKKIQGKGQKHRVAQLTRLGTQKTDDSLPCVTARIL